MTDPLLGTWTILALLPEGTRPPEGSAITFEDQRLSFYAGCNRAVGSYRVDGELLTAGPVAMTMMYCPDMSAEQHLCAALSEPLRVRIDGDLLQLLGDAGGLRARRA